MLCLIEYHSIQGILGIDKKQNKTTWYRWMRSFCLAVGGKYKRNCTVDCEGWGSAVRLENLSGKRGMTWNKKRSALTSLWRWRHQIYHGDWKSHRECLINTCINGWRHGIDYTQVQKLSNLLQKCTYVQISINYFHKTATGAVLFTGLPPFNLKSVSQYSIPHGR